MAVDRHKLGFIANWKRRIREIKVTHHFPPISIVVCLNSGEAGNKFYNALQHSDVRDGDKLLPYVEDRLQQWRCFVVPVAKIMSKDT